MPLPEFWVFPSVFAVIYNPEVSKEIKNICFCSPSQSLGAMIAVCISSPGLYLSRIILMDDHCKRDWR